MSFLLNYLTKYLTEKEKQQEYIYRWCFGIILILAGVMALVDWSLGALIPAAATGTFTVLTALILCVWNRNKELRNKCMIAFYALLIIFMSALTILGTPENCTLIWVFIVPSFGPLLLGLRTSLTITIIQFVIQFLLFYSPLKMLCISELPYTYRVNFTLYYLAASVMGLFFELTKEAAMREMSLARDKYQYWYNHDTLTEALNRMGYQQYIDEKMKKSNSETVGLMLADIDHFKKINDHYGHIKGDDVLRHVVKILEEHSGHTVVRWGGEEFCVLYPNGDMTEEEANKLCKAVEASPILIGDEWVKVTISIGAIVMPSKDAFENEKIISVADSLMYQAKQNGRNQICYRNDCA